MSLHAISPEFTFPALTDKVKQGIAFFLHYYNGDFSIVSSSNPTPSGINVWYYNPTDLVLHGFRSADLGYWAEDGERLERDYKDFNWNMISIIQNPGDSFEIKRYTR